MAKVAKPSVTDEPPFDPVAWREAYKATLKEGYRVKLTTPHYGVTCTILEYKRWRYETQLQYFYDRYETAINADLIYEVLYELLDEVNAEISNPPQSMLWGEQT